VAVFHAVLITLYGIVKLGYAGGFVGPLMVGWVLDLSGGMSQLGWGMSFLSVSVLMGLALITFWIIRPSELEGDRGNRQ
jgi:dipeptide/tripeptide permease